MVNPGPMFGILNINFSKISKKFQVYKDNELSRIRPRCSKGSSIDPYISSVDFNSVTDH